MLKDRKGPYPYPKRDVSKIPMFNYAEMDRQRQERAEQAAKKWTYGPLPGQLPKEEPHKDDAVELPLKELSASPKNAFRQLDEEIYSELKASLQASGLVYPVIVRPKDSIQSYPINGEYEILAGHNRVRAARDLGWETIKASIVRVDDVQAVRIINDSNLQRTGVTELEKAWAYRQLFDAMQRQGQRTDLMAMLEGQSAMEDDGLRDTVSQSSNGSKRTSDTIGEVCELPDTVSESSKRETVDIIGEMYGQSGRTVRRKIRLTYLIDELYRLYDRKDISRLTSPIWIPTPSGCCSSCGTPTASRWRTAAAMPCGWTTTSGAAAAARRNTHRSGCCGSCRPRQQRRRPLHRCR